MMSDAELPFSHEYAKHDRAVFPTIRRRDKFGDVGDVVTVTVGQRGETDKLGDAEIVAKETVQFRNLPTWLLCYDCEISPDSETPNRNGDLRAAAHDSLSSFYRNSIEMSEPLTMYWLRWVGDSEQAELVTDGGVDTDRDTVAWAYRDSTNRLVARIYDQRLASDLESSDDYHISWADDSGGENDA